MQFHGQIKFNIEQIYLEWENNKQKLNQPKGPVDNISDHAWLVF